MKYKDNQGNWVSIALPSLDSMPVGTIVDYDGTDIPTGWEEVNDYSTTEINTGKKWIDGKPIYRKGIQFSFRGSSGENSFNTDISSISNFNNFVSLNFSALLGTNLYISQNFYSDSNNYFFIFYRNKKIEYRLGVGASTALNGYAFIEYTKTTD